MTRGCSASAPSVSGAGGAAVLPKSLLSSTEGLPQSHRPMPSPVTVPRRVQDPQCPQGVVGRGAGHAQGRCWVFDGLSWAQGGIGYLRQVSCDVGGKAFPGSCGQFRWPGVTPLGLGGWMQEGPKPRCPITQQQGCERNWFVPF